MARKLYCKNNECKHHTENDSCNRVARIGCNGYCQNFEKGFYYYIHLVWRALGKSNYIDFIDINGQPDLRIGIYYVCKIYHLHFSVKEWAACRMLQFHMTENGDGLSYDQIVKGNLDVDECLKLENEFLQGNIPRLIEEKRLKDYQPFGWLSPTGTFTEADIARHEQEAGRLIDHLGFRDEYKAWWLESHGRTKRDFLVNVKGYCLVHNPSGSGGYIVSYEKNLTRKQREFYINTLWKLATDSKQNYI